MNIYTCFGEFGYYNFYILPALNVYFSKGGPRFGVITYPDYYNIFELLFPGKIEAVELLEQDPRRSCFISRRYDKPYDNFQKINVFLESFIASLPNPLNLYHEREKLRIQLNGERLDKIKRRFSYLENYDVQVFYLRKRIAGSERNYQHNINWNSFYSDNNFLVFINDTEEALGIFENSGRVYNTKNIYENIFFFNICHSFVSCDSGIIDFAKHCGCPRIQILPTTIPINKMNYRKYNNCITTEIESKFLFPQL